MTFTESNRDSLGAARGSDTRTIAASGELDVSNHLDLHDRAMQAVDDPCVGGLVLDLRAVTFLDSTTLGTVVAVYNRCREVGCGFTVEVSPVAERLFRMTALDDLLAGTQAKP